ncbi:hypothetical protein [Thiorhodovibrio frisius]|uniref:hypothetical protein n=1 Tax=Thiorhodovibrio frisius TaxID=631362 RepID=UPI000255EEAD|nr:hypothetical protein [Thiorhodovibrio frisius]
MIPKTKVTANAFDQRTLSSAGKMRATPGQQKIDPMAGRDSDMEGIGYLFYQAIYSGQGKFVFASLAK